MSQFMLKIWIGFTQHILQHSNKSHVSKRICFSKYQFYKYRIVETIIGTFLDIEVIILYCSFKSNKTF